MTKEKEQKSVIPLLITIVFTVYKVMSSFVGDIDELWNYNMSRGIVMGYLPYRDYSMVQTPLFAFFNAIFLSVSKTLLAYRISCSLILLAVMLLVFYLVRSVTNDLYALPVAMLSIVFADIVSYNTVFFIFTLLSYILLMKQESRKRDLLLGSIAALAALSRQTSGTLLLLIMMILLITPVCGKKTSKEKAESIFSYLLGIAVPCTVFLIYLIVTHSFFDFWDHCLFSLFSFGSGNSRIFAGSVPMIAIILLGIICDIKLIKEDKNRAIIHMLLSVPVLFVGIPIVDRPHMIYGAIWFMIPVAEYIKRYLGKSLRPAISVFLSAVLSVVIVALGAVNMLETSFVSDRPELKGLPVRNDLINDYSIIADKNREYEEAGYNVTTFSYSSILVSLFEGDYDPPYDMFLKGNLGLHEPMEYVEAACADPDAVILMPNDYVTEGWQNPEGVYEYVTEHCTPVAEYGRYVWYRPVSEGTVE